MIYQPKTNSVILTQTLFWRVLCKIFMTQRHIWSAMTSAIQIAKLFFVSIYASIVFLGNILPTNADCPKSTNTPSSTFCCVIAYRARMLAGLSPLSPSTGKTYQNHRYTSTHPIIFCTLANFKRL